MFGSSSVEEPMKLTSEAKQQTIAPKQEKFTGSYTEVVYIQTFIVTLLYTEEKS